MPNDIVLVADYHDKNIEFRRFDEVTQQEQRFNRPNEPQVFLNLVEEAGRQCRPRGGKVRLIMESTTGWARVKRLVRGRADMLLVNVLEMPQAPRAHRKKCDKLDTARILREYRGGELPLSFQPRPSLRRLRRLVALDADLGQRHTALANWVNRYLAHETWTERKGLWSGRGQQRLKDWAQDLGGTDRLIFREKLEELDQIQERRQRVQSRLIRIARRWNPARRLDAIDGIGPVGAVAIAACIGPIERFARPESLIDYAGLSPSVRNSDRTRRSGHIGGGGTDSLLRHYLVEASVWARRIPRYQATYARMAKRRGTKVGRLHVARMLLRSIDAMLRHGQVFEPRPPIPKRIRPLPFPSGGCPPEGGGGNKTARRRALMSSRT